MTGSLCASCKHFRADVEDNEVCSAFPDGIPESIAFGGSHLEHVEGDHGIKYEPIEGFEWMTEKEDKE